MTACTGYYAVLHTQEVTGSSPAVSTKQFLISLEIRNCFCLYPQIVTRHFGVFRSTQTVTQKPRGQESTGEGRMELGVLGWLTASSPLMRFTCLLTEMVMFSTSKSVHSKASSSPRRRPVVRAPDGRPPAARAVLLQPDTGRSCPPAVFSSPAFPAMCCPAAGRCGRQCS